MNTLQRVLLVILSIAVIIMCITASLFIFDFAKNKIDGKYSSIQDSIFNFLASVYDRSQAKKTDTFEDNIQRLIENQQEMDDWLTREYQGGNYDFENPLIVVNPYGTSPMSAAILFHTDEPSKVSILVESDEKLTEIAHSFSNYETDHLIPVLGLYPGCENHVEISISAKNGRSLSKSFSIETDYLCDSLNRYDVRTYMYNKEEYQTGLNFYYTNGENNMKFAIDAEGEYRWALDLTDYPAMMNILLMSFEYCDGNRMFVSFGGHDYGSAYFAEFNALGKLKTLYHANDGSHHDLELSKADNTLFITGGTEEDEESVLYGINLDSGDVDYHVVLTDIMQYFRNQLGNSYGQFYNIHDTLHFNNIDEMDDGSLILSLLMQSTIVCMDRDTNIKWMLCDPKGYAQYYKQFILKPVGDHFLYPNAQHHANELPDLDGDPDTVDILVFDNGSIREEKISRMIQYRINTTAMTAEVVWTYGDNRPEIFSNVQGSAFYLKNGNRLGSYSVNSDTHINQYSYGVEVDENGNIVWECYRLSKDRGSGCNAYRIERADIYTDVEDGFQNIVKMKVFE